MHRGCWIIVLVLLYSPFDVSAQEIDKGALRRVEEACLSRQKLFSRFEGQWTLKVYDSKRRKPTRDLTVKVAYEFPTLKIECRGTEVVRRGVEREVNYEEFVDPSGRRRRDLNSGTIVTDERSKPNYLRGQKIEAANEIFVTHAGEPLTTYLSSEYLVGCAVDPKHPSLIVVRAKASFSDDFQYRITFDTNRQLAPISHETWFRQNSMAPWGVAYSITINQWRKVSGFSLPSEATVISFDDDNSSTTHRYSVVSLAFPAVVKPANETAGKPAYDRMAGRVVGDVESYKRRAQELDALLDEAKNRLAKSNQDGVLRMPWILRWGKRTSWAAWFVAGLLLATLFWTKPSRKLGLAGSIAATILVVIAIICLSLNESESGRTKWGAITGSLSDPELEKTCGVASLYLTLHSSGRDLEYAQLAESVPLDLIKGTSIRGLQAGLASLGLNDVVKLRRPQDTQDTNVALLHVLGDHYVACVGEADGRSVVVDPVGNVIEIESEYLNQFLSGWRLVVD